MRLKSKIVVLVAILAMIAAACGDDDDTTPSTPAPPPATDAPPAATDAPTPPATDAPTPPATDAPTPPATDPPTDAGPIIIGAAIDQTDVMAVFDGPAIAAAQIRIDEINAAGGVMGRMLELRVTDTELDPDQTAAAAIDFISNGAHILFVTCDVDFATPAVTEGINAGLLTISACIGTDQMGPNRFGEAGRLAFSFGNVAQDEGAAMAEFAFDKGKRTAALVTDNLLVYFQDIIEAFKVRWLELGGTIVAEESFTSFDGTIGNVVTAIDGVEADIIAVSSAFPDLPATFTTQLRALGNNTTIICSWACDGSFWVPAGLNDFYYVTFASVFGDDPDPAVNALASGVAAATGGPPPTGSFVNGAAVIDAIVAAIEATGGNTDGAALAAAFEAFDGLPTISGSVSFSPDQHTVFGREYRVITIMGGVNAFNSLWTASSPAVIR